MAAKDSAEKYEIPGFGGTLISPGDAGYDDARKLFNGMIDRRPAVIARCTSADDVVGAVNLARDGRADVVGARRRPRRDGRSDVRGRCLHRPAGDEPRRRRPAGAHRPGRGRRSRGAKSTPPPRSTVSRQLAAG